MANGTIFSGVSLSWRLFKLEVPLQPMVGDRDTLALKPGPSLTPCWWNPAATPPLLGSFPVTLRAAITTQTHVTSQLASCYRTMWSLST